MNHHNHPSLIHSAEATKLQRRRQRVKSLLLLSGVSFLVVILLDGVIQLTVFDGRTTFRDEVVMYGSAVEESSVGRQLIVGNGNGDADNDIIHMSRLDQLQQQQQPQQAVNNFPPANIINNPPIQSGNIPRISRSSLHRLPLLPKHALQNRQRRDLYHAQKPLPMHLRHDYDDAMYHAPPEKRRRMYPIIHEDENVVVDARTHRRRRERTNRRRKTQQQQQHNKDDETQLYETGSLYQGYGTHYIDVYVGTPHPQRQTLIIDTGSSITFRKMSATAESASNNSKRM